jgi:hypothetical protein
MIEMMGYDFLMVVANRLLFVVRDAGFTEDRAQR